MRERLHDILKRFRILRSLKARIFLIIFLVGIIPCLVLHYGILSNYESTAVRQRTSAVQTQLMILANHLIVYDYLNDTSSAVINAELEQLSSLYDGRVLVINDRLEVVKDTYGISEGKTIISEEVINCLKRGSKAIVSHYDRTAGYIEMITPISETASLENQDVTGTSQSETEVVRGVLLTSISSDSIMAIADALSRRIALLEIIIVLVVFSIALLLAGAFVRPFAALTKAISEVKAGYSNDPIYVPAYLETEQMGDAFNQVISRMRSLDESRQEFVSNVSHELKTPMTSMKVLADSLLSQEDVPAEMYREFLVDIDQEIDRENKIISELLTLVKMDNKALSMNITTVNINELTEIILKRVRPLAQKRDIELLLVSEREISAEIDEVKMTMVITNLIENAVKYNREHGKVTVTLDADHKDFTLMVQDTGIGIPRDSFDKIYDRFYRVDKSRSREVGGTGLGLAITKSAVLMHRGTIRVDSREGEGTTFTVSIPLIYVANPAAMAKVPKEKAAAAKKEERRREKQAAEKMREEKKGNKKDNKKDRAQRVREKDAGSTKKS
ncbi:MAG: HAMP domain-containing sensor histidine kinase [Eubacteriales bacterium]|nr:HAMP domain-containing sensor histidine kinase [Eubacteriales bacterium]